MSKRSVMKKKSSNFLIISIIAIIVLFGVIAAFVIGGSTTHSNVSFGHGGDEVIVTYRGVSSNLDSTIADLSSRMNAVKSTGVSYDGNGCIVGSQTWCATTSQCLANGATCVAPVATFDFTVKVDVDDKNPSLNLENCDSIGYDWVAHIHSWISSGIATSSENPKLTTSSGWLTLCSKSSNRERKDIVAKLVTNSCAPFTNDGPCPSDYTEIGRFTRNGNVCDVNRPTLATVLGGNDLSSSNGVMAICQKGVPEYYIANNCGSNIELGMAEGQRFCKTKDGSPYTAPSSVCGNSILEGSEVCDSDTIFRNNDLANCDKYSQGEYSCNSICSGYDFVGCN